MSSTLKFIWVGKLKKNFWKEAAFYYWQRLSRSYSLREVQIKEQAGDKNPQTIRQKESQAILVNLSNKDTVISLDKQGEMLSSEKLAKFLLNWVETPGKDPCFVLGGAFGLSKHLRNQSHYSISFGPVTLPNELARILLLEQLYRATTINQNHPYHH